MHVSWKHRVAHSQDLQGIVQGLKISLWPRSLQVLTSNTLWDVVGQKMLNSGLFKTASRFFLGWHSWSKCESWAHLDQLWFYEIVLLYKSLLLNIYLGNVKVLCCWACIRASSILWSHFSVMYTTPTFCHPLSPKLHIKTTKNANFIVPPWYFTSLTPPCWLSL